jgi:hypothetical protein
VVLDDGGDQKRARDGDRLASNLGVSGRELQGMKLVVKRPKVCVTTSTIVKCGQFGEGRATAAGRRASDRLGFGS